MHPRPSPNYLPAELLILVGKIAIQSAYVDALVGDALGALRGIPYNNRSSTIHVLDTRRKVQEAKELLNAAYSGPKRIALLAPLERAGDLLADRNLVLHGLIAYRTPELTDPLYVAFRGKYAGKEVPFSRETLESILTQLDELSRELMGVCSELGAHELPPSPGK
jgi:hypothetical protein